MVVFMGFFDFARVNGRGILPDSRVSLAFGVIDHALEIHDHRVFHSFHPGVVTRREKGHVTRIASHFGPVIHADDQDSGNVVLEVGRLATWSLGKRFHAGGPFPTGLQRGTADDGSSDLDELDLSFVELTDFVWIGEAPGFGDFDGLNHTLRRIHGLVRFAVNGGRNGNRDTNPRVPPGPIETMVAISIS